MKSMFERVTGWVIFYQVLVKLIIVIFRWKELIGDLNPEIIRKLLQVPRVSVPIQGLDDDDDDVDEFIPEDNEQLMKQVASDFFSIISDCSARVVSNYSLYLRLLVMNMNKDPKFSKPFIPVQEIKTQTKYSKYGCGLLLMVIRSHLDPETFPLPDYVKIDAETTEHIQGYLDLINIDDDDDDDVSEDRKLTLQRVFVSMFACIKPNAAHNHSFPAVFYILLSCFRETSGNLESLAARHAIAGVLYCYRLLMLELMAGLDLNEQRGYNEFFVLSRYTPFSALLMTQKLCAAIAKQTSHIPNFFWDCVLGQIDNTSGRIAGQRVTLSMLQTGLQSLRGGIEKEFASIIAGFKDHNKLQLHHFREDPRSSSENYNFKLDSRNKLLVETINNFMGHIYPKLFRNGSLIASAGKTFLSKCVNLRKLMLVYIHMTSGQPARATELEMYTIVNTRERGRTVKQMEDYNIILHQTYGKVDQIRTSDTSTLRFLDPQFGLLFNKYLALVRSVESLIIGMIKLRDDEVDEDVQKRIVIYETYLWVSRGGRQDSNEIRRAFQNTFQKIFNINLSFSQYRHVHIAFMNEHLKCKIDDYSEDFDEQAGHSSEVADQYYARSNFTVDHESRKSYVIKLILSFKWMALLKILPGVIPNSFQPTSEYNYAVTQIASQTEYLRSTAGAVQQAVSLSHCKYYFLSLFEWY